MSTLTITDTSGELLDVALMEYFKTVFDDDDVVEAKVALDISNLEQNVATREKYVQNLEVSTRLYIVRNVVPMNIRTLLL